MYTFSSVLYLFLKYLLLTVRALHINPKTSLPGGDDSHSCFSSHISTVCVLVMDQTPILLLVILASGSEQVPAVCIRVKLFVK